MALRDFDSYRKPVNEPFRDWDFDHCEYCHGKVSLFSNKCDHCGYSRNYHDQKMIKTLLAWRDSEEGQAAWKKIQDEAKERKRKEARYYNIGLMYITIMSSVIGFLGFGFVGLFFDAPLAWAIVGSISLPAIVRGALNS